MLGHAEAKLEVAQFAFFQWFSYSIKTADVGVSKGDIWPVNGRRVQLMDGFIAWL
jgi:hypothetical protein